MKVQEFTLEKYLKSLDLNPQQLRSYYSEVYQREFPLKRDLVAKLEPIAKEDVKLWLPDFEKRNFPNSRFGNFRDHPLHFAQDEYFLFRYGSYLDRKTTKFLQVRFRTQSENPLIDDFLEYLQESLNLSFCYTEDLSASFSPKLKEIYAKTIKDCQELIDNPKDDLIYAKKNKRYSYIKGVAIDIFSSIQLLENKGYCMNKSIEEIRTIKITRFTDVWRGILEKIFNNIAFLYKD